MKPVISLITAGLIVVKDRKLLLAYFSTLSYKGQPQQVPGVIQVMQQLQQDDLID